MNLEQEFTKAVNDFHQAVEDLKEEREKLGLAINKNKGGESISAFIAGLLVGVVTTMILL